MSRYIKTAQMALIYITYWYHLVVVTALLGVLEEQLAYLQSRYSPQTSSHSAILTQLML